MNDWMPTRQVAGMPKVGDIIAINCDDLRYRPWLLSRLEQREDGSWSMILREPGAPDLASSDMHHIASPRLPNRHVSILPQRYALCSCCGELMPCSHEVEDRTVEAMINRAHRYETAGTCPACGEVVSDRQQSIRFDINLHVPLGPPVTFHRRQNCFYGSAIGYEKAVAKAEGVPAKLSCPGSVTRHSLPGASTCTSPTCPGPDVGHASMDQICLFRPCPECATTALTATESETP